MWNSNENYVYADKLCELLLGLNILRDFINI